MAVMVTELSPEVIFRTRRIMKQCRWCKELASARRATSHDRNPAEFLENDKRPPIGGHLLLRSQHAPLDAARMIKIGPERSLVLRAYFGEELGRTKREEVYSEGWSTQGPSVSKPYTLLRHSMN